jgi:hypothetical protein
VADESLRRDDNFKNVIAGVTDDTNKEIVQIRVDPTTKRLKVAASATEEDGHGSVGDGTQTVATAGTAVQLSSSSVSCKRVFVQCHKDNGDLANKGLVVIGGSTVVAAANGRRGHVLYPTQGDWFKVNNLNLLYVDSLDNNAKVHFYYEN